MAVNTLSVPTTAYAGMAGGEQRLQGVAAAADSTDSVSSDWLWSQLAEPVDVTAGAVMAEPASDAASLLSPEVTAQAEVSTDTGQHDAALPEPTTASASDHDGDVLAEEAGLLLSWQPVLLPQVRSLAVLGTGQQAGKTADATQALFALRHTEIASLVSALPMTRATLESQMPGAVAPLPALESQMPAPLTASEGSRHEALLAAVPVMTAGTPQGVTLSRAEWSPVALPMDQSAQWGQQLVDTLKERVEMQVHQQVKQAHIRLDPPELGKLDLTVRVEGERVTVQLNAAHPAVREALIQSTERLRMALAPHHSGGVDVNVGQGERQGREALPWQEEAVLTGRRSRQASAEEEQASSGDWLRLDTRV